MHCVAAMGVFQGNGQNGRNRGGNRGNARSRHDSRNSRNRQTLTRFVDVRNVHSGMYSPDEYRRLTPSQREAVKTLLQQQARQHQNECQSNSSTRAVVSGVSASVNNDSKNTAMPTNTSSDTPTSSFDMSRITAPSRGGHT